MSFELEVRMSVSALTRLVDIHEAARIVHLSVATLHAYTRRGEISSYKVGAFRKYDPDVLARELLERGRRSARAAS